MAYLILGQRIPPDTYRDEIGVRYNYPRRYWKRIHSGDRIIYHQPRSRSGEGMVYFGCGIIGDIEVDVYDPKRRNAEILDYTSFPKLVPVISRGRFVEPLVYGQIDMLGNAVREIDEATALKIMGDSGVQPPWSWETGPPGALSAAPPMKVSRRKLIDAVRRFDEHHATLPPERRNISLNSLHRPSFIGKVLKELYGTRCRICGVEGFLQRNGIPYAEVHHIEEVSTGHPGVLGSGNMIIVCATCHRKIHFANVSVVPGDFGWNITINGETTYVARLRMPS